MIVLVRDAQRGRLYRRPRGEQPGRWLEVHPLGADALGARLMLKKNRLASEAAMITRLSRRPELVPMRVHTRGVDPFTGDQYETRWTVLVPPDVRLREVARRPGFGDM